MAEKNSSKWIYSGIAAFVLLAIASYGVYTFGQNDADKSKYTFRASVTNDCTGPPGSSGASRAFLKNRVSIISMLGRPWLRRDLMLLH